MSCFDNIATEYIGSNNDYENNGLSNVNCGQSFQVQQKTKVCGFSIYGSRGTVNQTGDDRFKFEILQGAYNGGVVIATTDSLENNALTAYGSPQWNALPFNNEVVLEPNVTYYLKCTLLKGSSNDILRWSYDNTSPSYPYGSYYYNNVISAGKDRSFKIFGEPYIEPVQDSTNFLLFF